MVNRVIECQEVISHTISNMYEYLVIQSNVQMNVVPVQSKKWCLRKEQSGYTGE